MIDKMEKCWSEMYSFRGVTQHSGNNLLVTKYLLASMFLSSTSSILLITPSILNSNLKVEFPPPEHASTKFIGYNCLHPNKRIVSESMNFICNKYFTSKNGPQDCFYKQGIIYFSL